MSECSRHLVGGCILHRSGRLVENRDRWVCGLTAASWGKASLPLGTWPASHTDSRSGSPVSPSPGWVAATLCCSSHSPLLQRGERDNYQSQWHHSSSFKTHSYQPLFWGNKHKWGSRRKQKGGGPGKNKKDRMGREMERKTAEVETADELREQDKEGEGLTDRKRRVREDSLQFMCVLTSCRQVYL